MKIYLVANAKTTGPIKRTGPAARETAPNLCCYGLRGPDGAGASGLGAGRPGGLGEGPCPGCPCGNCSLCEGPARWRFNGNNGTWPCFKPGKPE